MTTTALRRDRTGREIFGITIAGALVILFNIIAYAYAMVKLWLWFIVPTFAAPALSMPVAYGIMVLLSLLQPPPKTDPADKDDTAVIVLAKGFFMALFRCGIALLAGRIALHFA